jgi:DNA-directed RNA polymerase
MSIKAHLEQAIKSLEIEREKEVAIIKERVTREKIVPFNQEMDIARDKAIAEKQQALNATIIAHQENFAKEKKEIIEAGEKKKEKNATAVITSEAYSVTVNYDKAIAKLKEQIAELKE